MFKYKGRRHLRRPACIYCKQDRGFTIADLGDCPPDPFFIDCDPCQDCLQFRVNTGTVALVVVRYRDEFMWEEIQAKIAWIDTVGINSFMRDFNSRYELFNFMHTIACFNPTDVIIVDQSFRKNTGGKWYALITEGAADSIRKTIAKGRGGGPDEAT